MNQSLLIIFKPMQSQSGSRFNQGYYQPPQYSNPQQSSQSPFSPYTPLEPVNPTFTIPSPQTSSLINPNKTPTSTPVFIVPKPDTNSDSKRQKAFSQLQIEVYYRKYNVRRDSPMYYFQSDQLLTIMKKFQKQFPSTMVEQVKRNEKEFENGFYPILRNTFYITILYWVISRRFNWFKLTQNYGLKLGGLLYCNLKMVALEVKEMRAFEDKAFANYQYFESVIEKYQLGNQNLKRLEMAS